MKKILSIITLLGILCLMGCSKEEPQSVAFSIKDISVDSKSNFIPVKIQSNCPWTISKSEGNPISSVDFGEGPASILVSVWGNKSYDDLQHVITISSKDGTSTDKLIIKQQASFGLKLDAPDMINCEGGDFQLKIQTNDNIVSIDTPEWITHTSNRSLTGYTYTFTAEPNKTGRLRKGTIKFNGENLTDRVKIEQDSYAPTGIIIKDLPLKTLEENINCTLELEPSHADWDKVDIFTDGDCLANVNGNTLYITGMEYGENTIKFYSNNNEIYNASITRFPKKLIKSSSQKEICIGKEEYIGLEYYSNDYEITSSNPSVIRVPNKNGHIIIGEGIGWTTITVSHPELGIKDSIEVYSDWITIQAEISQIVSISDIHDIRLGAIIQSGYPMEIDGFIITDANNGVILANKGSLKDVGKTQATIITDVISIPKSVSISPTDAVKGFKFHIFVRVGGNAIQRSVVVNHKKSGYIK